MTALASTVLPGSVTGFSLGVSPGRQVFIIDNDLDLRTHLRRVAEAGGMRAQLVRDTAGFIAAYKDDGPACLVVGLASLPGGAAKVQERLLRNGIDIPVIYLTDKLDVHGTKAAFHAGAADVFERPVTALALQCALERAFALECKRRLEKISYERARARLAALSQRELDVLALLAEGNSSAQIGKILNIASRTVEAHRSKMCLKTGAKRATDLVRLAILVGLTPKNIS